MTIFAPRRNVYYGWWMVGALAITETISWGILYYAFSVFITPMEQDLGWSRSELTGAFSLALLVAGFGAVPVGYWIDRYGSRLLMTVGSCVAAVLVFLWARVDDLRLFYPIWFVIGLTMATVLYDPAFAVAAKWFTKQRAKALAIITFAAGFASTIFIPLAEALLRTQGWRGAITTLAILLAVTTIPLHALVLRRHPHDLGLNVDGLDKSSDQSPDEKPERSIATKVALRQPAFWWLTAAFALAMLSSISIRVHFIPYLIDHGFDTGFAALASGLIGAMQVMGRVIFAPLHARLATRGLAAALFSLLGVALLILLVSQTNVAIILFVVVFGSANGAITLARPALIVETYGAAHYGRISSVMVMFLTWAATAAPIGTSLLQERFGSYQPVLIILFALAIGAVLVIAGLKTDPSLQDP